VSSGDHDDGDRSYLFWWGFIAACVLIGVLAGRPLI
jgi:hypothetical protein